VITDVTGDTIRTLEGPATAGVHRVVWNFAGRTPPPVALSPSQKRDSTWLANRINVVFDSMVQAGGNAQTLNGIRQGLLSGDLQELAQRFGFGGGGGGGGGGGAGQAAVRAGAPFVERPGETPARAPGRAAGAAPQAEGESQEAAPDPGMLGQLAALLRRPGQTGGGGLGGLGFIAQTFGRAAVGGGGFGGFGGGGAAAVASGDYLVSITVDGKTMSRVLRVERVAN
jgi:hypothetical protein